MFRLGRVFPLYCAGLSLNSFASPLSTATPTRLLGKNLEPNTARLGTPLLADCQSPRHIPCLEYGYLVGRSWHTTDMDMHDMKTDRYRVPAVLTANCFG